MICGLSSMLNRLHVAGRATRLCPTPALCLSAPAPDPEVEVVARCRMGLRSGVDSSPNAPMNVELVLAFRLTAVLVMTYMYRGGGDLGEPAPEFKARIYLFSDF